MSNWIVLFPLSVWATLVGFAACVSSNNESEGLQLTPEEQKKISQYEAELNVGRNMAGRLLQHFGTYEEEKALRYLNTVGQLVVQNSPYSERRFVFGILDTSTVNAFAIPGGYVLVTRGALEQAESEAELAAILGHEIAHIGKKHVYDTMLKRMDEDKEEKEKERAERPDAIKARERPRADKNEVADTLAKYLGGAAGSQINILSAISKGLGVLLEEGLDPDLEYEADEAGLQYAIAAGYEPRAGLAYYKRILKEKESKSMAVLNKTHPSVDSRIEKLETKIGEIAPEGYHGALGKKRYMKVFVKEEDKE